VFAHWGRGTGSAKVELVFPGGTYGIRKRLMSADLIPLAEALPSLLAVEASERTRQGSRTRASAAAATTREFRLLLLTLGLYCPAAPIVTSWEGATGQTRAGAPR
jgi:hypothetical protein